MLFNSLEFALFLPLVFLLHWFVAGKRVWSQNLLILAASYVFYGWWDWRFLSLIVLSSTVDYLVGLGFLKFEGARARRALLLTSIAINLGILGTFKYFNFFVENFIAAFASVGIDLHPVTLNVLLPVGISFYTFQTLSYSIDCYRRKMTPTRNLLAFFTFVAFFPQLVAGPIERATRLLPQFFEKRRFDRHQAVDGLRQMLWGLFKKIVIADSCAVYVDQIFGNHYGWSGEMLLLGAVLFAFQIYCDFSGYSDIAIGCARLFGIRLMRNFAYPYFSRDIAEFWRRWHISLSTWFRDYVYIPLGGSRGGRARTVRNIFVIFLVSGLWHGANWTFLAWGALNAAFILPLVLRRRNRRHLDSPAEGRVLPGLRETGQILATFGLTVLAWIFFRAESVSQAASYLRNLFRGFGEPSLFSPADGLGRTLGFIALLVTVEWIQRNRQHGLQLNGALARPVRWLIYYALIAAIFAFGGPSQQFIYFQF
jgi:D-alanyl-lipoteichoic acid acyltransferase DltB (MBOAT superfamily)